MQPSFFLQCNRTISLDVLYSQLLHEPRKLAIIGGGCSIATEPTAEVSHYYNITQVSPHCKVIYYERISFQHRHSHNNNFIVLEYKWELSPSPSPSPSPNSSPSTIPIPSPNLALT